MKLALLGPVELTDSGGSRIEVASRRQRQLLVILGLHRGRVVDVERIAELIWGDDRPMDPAGTVQTNVSRLRPLLDAPLAVETGPVGYVFTCPEANIDLGNFEQLVTRVRNVQVQRRPELAADCLALWRGTPLSDLDHPDIVAERQRFTELRLELTETLAEALYELGRFGEAIAVAEQHVREYPYRERPVGTLRARRGTPPVDRPTHWQHSPIYEAGSSTISASTRRSSCAMWRWPFSSRRSGRRQPLRRQGSSPSMVTGPVPGPLPI